MNFKKILELANMDKKNNTKWWTLVIAVGIAAVAGVAAGILIAPKSGKETYKLIKNKAVDTAEAIRDTIQEKIEMVQDGTQQAAYEISSAGNAVQGKAKAVKKEMKDGLGEIKQDIQKTTENISDELKKSDK